MPYVEDENGNHIYDDDGNKIEYTVTYDNDPDFIYTHREKLHIDDDGHVNTEDRNIVIKDGVNSNHAISKGQLDNANLSLQTSVNNLDTKITGDIQTAISNLDTKIGTQIQTAITTSENRIEVQTEADIQTAVNSMSSVVLNTVQEQVMLNLSETLFWESYQLADCLYKCERGLSTEVSLNKPGREVIQLFDQSLKENHAIQTTNANRPLLCTKAEKTNFRYYLKFDGSKRMISDINLNPVGGAADIVNVYIVYRLNSFTGTHAAVRNGLFGHDDAGWDKFVCFSIDESLVVSGADPQFVVIGSSGLLNVNPIADYQSKANASELNKWISLSVHWDVPGGSEASEIWCNGKKLANFTARSSTGSNQMIFGDLNPNGKAGLKGDIAFYCLYKGEKHDELRIKLHHHVMCNWFLVDCDPILGGNNQEVNE